MGGVEGLGLCEEVSLEDCRHCNRDLVQGTHILTKVLYRGRIRRAAGGEANTYVKHAGTDRRVNSKLTHTQK